MKKSIFTRIISVMLICMMMIGSMAALTVSAEETESATPTPTVEIVSKNIVYGETLKLKYAVKTSELADGQTLQVVICNAQGDVICETVANGNENVKGESLPTFTSEKGVPAQNIAGVVYAHAQIIENGEVIAEDVEEYSVLEYLWERLTVSENVTEAQRNMYNALLAYAAAADIALNGVEESAISTSTYVAVVENGAVVSGGMYQAGDVVELTTALVPGENEKLIWNVTVDGVNTQYEAEELANGYTVVAGATVISAEIVADDAAIDDGWTIAEALAAAEGTEVVLTGTVVSIYQAWSDEHGNISVYIQDEAGDQILAYRLATKVYIGDVITVTGTIGVFNEVNQIAAGCTAIVDQEHAHTYTEASCTAPATCTACGKPDGEALGHTDPNAEGKCDRCGMNLSVASTTVNVVIKDYANANGWANSTQYGSLVMDENITVTNSAGSNTGKYYTSGYEWRMYMSDSGTVTITAAEGKTIVSVKITYNAGNNGTLVLDGTNIASDAVVEVNAGSVTFSVGRTSGTKQGQAKITAIEVVYQ